MRNAPMPYTTVSLATDIYATVNDHLPERNVPMNLYAIPELCNMLENHKTAKDGVYLGVDKEQSLMIVDDHPHINVDYDLKFCEVMKHENGIPFLEKHVALIIYESFAEAPYLSDVFNMCEHAGFIVD